MIERLRVGMNLAWLRPGIVGGSEVSATSTVDALDRFAGAKIDLRLYAQTAFAQAHPEIVERVPTRMATVPRGNRAGRVALESTWLPRMLHADEIDVVHCYGGVVPPRLGVPSVLTVHDVQPLEDDAAFDAVKRLWLRRMIPASVRRAALVTVPSQFVRNRLLELFDTDPAKVVVVHHGLDTAMVTDAALLPERLAIRQRFRLPAPFVLYPAITYPHKNHEVLVRAFAHFAKARPDVSLVLAGGVGESESGLNRLIEGLGVGSQVRRVGRVTNAERDALVQEAAVLAFPSRYEGFGLPVLEAFAADTPVVSSSAGSLPEVVGDAGLLIDPGDVEGWAAALVAALEGEQTSTAATRKRSAQLGMFDWRATSAQIVELYQQAASIEGARS